MSISKFITNKTYNLTQFYNWLQSKKSGTFLENMTVTLESAADNDSVLTIESAHAKLTFNPKESPSSWAVVSLTGESKTWNYENSGINYNTAGTWLVKAIICSKGIIFNTQTLYNSSAICDNYFGVTVDDSGEVALLRRNGYFNNSTTTGYLGVAYKSTNDYITTLTPAFNSSLTSIAPIVPTTSNEVKFPYAFAALHTQQNSFGLSAVSIDGSNYITDGMFYIKDA